MKKIISVMLSLLMVLTLCAGLLTVNAEDGYVAVNTYSAGFSVPALRLGPSSDRIRNAGAYFNAASPFNKITIPRYWSSNPQQSKRGNITIRFEVFAYDTDYDTSIAGTALFTKEFTTDKDQGSPFEINLGSDLPKGSYAISFTCLNEDDGLTRYFALPESNCVYSDVRIGFSQFTFAFTVNFVEDSALDSYFARLPGTEGIEELEDILFANDQNAGARKVNDDPMGVRFTIPEGRELKALIGIASPTWTENENNDVKVEIYAWNTDYDTTVSGEVIASATVIGDADNKDEVFELDKKVSAGEILAVFSATNSGSVGFYGANESAFITEVYASGTQISFFPRIAARYVLLEETQPVTEPETQPGTEPETQPATQPGTEPETQPGTEPETQPATEPGTEPETQPATEPETQPATEPQPQTGDMSITLATMLIVLAICAIVVFAKKRTF